MAHFEGTVSVPPLSGCLTSPPKCWPQTAHKGELCVCVCVRTDREKIYSKEKKTHQVKFPLFHTLIVLHRGNICTDILNKEQGEFFFHFTNFPRNSCGYFTLCNLVKPLLQPKWL